RYLDEDRISQGVLYGRLQACLAGEAKTPGTVFTRCGTDPSAACTATLCEARRHGSQRVFSAVRSSASPRAFLSPLGNTCCFAVPSKRSATGAPGSSPPARPKTTNFQHHTFCGLGATGGSSPRTWTPTSPGRAGPKN